MAIYKSFADIPDLFSKSIRNSGTASLFCSQQWFENYIRTVVPDQERVSIFATSSGEMPETAVLLPLYDEGRGARLSPRILCALANFYSSQFDLMWTRGADVPSKSIHDIVSEIVSTKPAWDVVRISPCRSDSLTYRQLLDAFSSNRWAVQEFHCFKNLYLKNNYQDFESFLASRSSRIRKTAANRARKFDRNPSSSFNIITRVDELEEGINLFSKLYEKRWKKSEPYPDFLPGLARLCAENGWLRLGIASMDGRPAAAQFWIIKDSTAYIYKVAYEEEFTKLSVGAVALFKMFQHVLNHENVREIDFLTGDDAYKKDWMSHSREMVGLVAFNKHSVRGLASASWHIGGRTLKVKLASSVASKYRTDKVGQ